MDLLTFTSSTKELNLQIHNDPAKFSELVLGISLHPGQLKWIWFSNHRLNILRPGNRFGKTLVTAIKHIWHCMCKPKLDGKVISYDEWLRVEYNTLNFGPTYELGRGALMLARDIVQGNILLPDGTTNQSMLKDWAIVDDRSEANVLPSLEFKTGSKIFGRSMNEMGVAFKMRKLAYISGDECADVPNLWTFTNNTLLMRVVDMDGTIDFVGTPQPEGFDYMTMIELAEEDMKRDDWEKSGNYYVQKGSIYENTFLPKFAIEEIERIADPMMREQIIRGEYVEIGDKYFGFERIQHSVDENIILVDYPESNRKYVTAFDPAGGESQWSDYTVIITIDYTEEPYRIVNFKRFKGGDVSIPMQYQLVSELVTTFHSQLVIDSSSLGGKNAMAFLSHLNPVMCEFGNMRGGSYKAEMLATLKIAFDGGQSMKFRRDRVKEGNDWVDKNPNWGLIRIPNIPSLINELQNYKLDDGKIRQDTVMALAMAIHWIEMRRPKMLRKKAVDMDFFDSGII
jgi:hypothetical protein